MFTIRAQLIVCTGKPISLGKKQQKWNDKGKTKKIRMIVCINTSML